ncbi:MAG TPA: hypothetical protein VF230_08465 [Acidimicrobiales bacterium]
MTDHDVTGVVRPAGGESFVAARLAAIVFVLGVAAWSAYDTYLPFWTDGVNTAAVAGFVLLFSLLPCAIAGAVALALRRRAQLAWMRYLLLAFQAGWVAAMAAVGFGLSDFAADEPAGWGLAAIAFGIALAVLGGLWWAEDAMARRE